MSDISKISKEQSILLDLNSLFSAKKLIIDKLLHTHDTTSQLELKKELLSIIDDKQLPLIGFLDNNTKDQFKYLLDQIGRHLASSQLEILERLGKLSKTHEQIIIDSLEQDLKKIIDSCKALRGILTIQATILGHDTTIFDERKIKSYNAYFEKESNIISDLDNIISKDSGMERNLLEHIRMVEGLEYNDWWARLIKKVAKLVVLRQYKIIVTGSENIPSNGPVVIASRHYHGDIDGGLLINCIPRRTFILTGIDWIPGKFQMHTTKFVFSKIGGIAMNRPDSPNKREDYPDASITGAVKKVVSALHLNQAVLIFPEGWPNIDSYYTPKKLDDGIIPLRPGIMRCVELAEKSLGKVIPIIPVGLIYHGLNDSKAEKIVEVNFGKPMYYFPHNGSSDAEREKFGEKLREQIVVMSRL